MPPINSLGEGGIQEDKFSDFNIAYVLVYNQRLINIYILEYVHFGKVYSAMSNTEIGWIPMCFKKDTNPKKNVIGQLCLTSQPKK